MAESEATIAFKQIDNELTTAQLQWSTFADILGSGYTAAYRTHKEILDGIKEMKRASTDTAYWVLSALCTGFAGGVVGGLMAPAINKAGIAHADELIVQTVKGGLREQSEQLASLPPKWIELSQQSRSNSVFQPATKDPLEYYLDIKSEIGLCFSRLRDDVTNFKKWADENNKPRSDGEWMLNSFRKDPLLLDHPKTDDMPPKTEVQRQAQIAMWIAWANVRHMEYWNRRLNAVKDGVHHKEASYMLEFRDFDPILSDLKQLGVGHFVELHVTLDYAFGSASRKKVLNIQVLRHLGMVLAIVPGLFGGTLKSDFLGELVAVIQDPHKVLPSMASLPPMYKR